MLDIDFDALRKGQRRALAKAITLSNQPIPLIAGKLLHFRTMLLRAAIVVLGSQGSGVGKSTFIEAFGLFLISLGKRVGVLAVDPLSSSWRLHFRRQDADGEARSRRKRLR